MLSAVYTDIGIEKKVNQDSCLLKEAVTAQGTILFAAVCDGMGGLKNGEVASACVVEELRSWFENDLSVLTYNGFTAEDVKKSLNRVIIMADKKIRSYGRDNGACGTTLSGVLLAKNRYLTVNVGDSRVYRIDSDSPHQLTHDQTLAQRRVDEGEITQEEALTDDGQNILLQCIGWGAEVVPSYTEGMYRDRSVFLLCSDGFRHRLTAEEIKNLFLPEKMDSETRMKRALRTGVETAMKRKENDNITAIVINTAGD